jgi:hypothetical protein
LSENVDGTDGLEDQAANKTDSEREKMSGWAGVVMLK